MFTSYLTGFEIRQEMHRDDFEIFYRRDAAPSRITLHSHDFYELYCLMDGKMDFNVNGCQYKIEPGMILLIAPGEMHRSEPQDTQREFERVVLWLSSDFINSLSTVLPRIVHTIAGTNRRWNLIVPDEDTYRVVHNLLFSLLYEKELADADSQFLSRLIVMQLMVHLSRSLSHTHIPEPGRQVERHTATMRVYEYINAHFREEIAVSSLAEQFYMDKNTLTRQFKRIIGLTPGEYIRRKRLENARDLLMQGTGAQEAGYQSGYGDYSAFYRAFRQEYGIAPSAITLKKNDKEHRQNGE